MNWLLAAAGLLGIWLCHLAPAPIVGVLILYGLALSSFFFTPIWMQPTWFLGGITVAQEFLTDQRLGVSTLLAFIVLLVAEVLGNQLRLTSRFVRFTVGLALVYTSYTLMLVPVSRWIPLLPSILVSGAIVLLLIYPRSIVRSDFSDDLLP